METLHILYCIQTVPSLTKKIKITLLTQLMDVQNRKKVKQLSQKTTAPRK